jgi:hypothetical protein
MYLKIHFGVLKQRKPRQGPYLGVAFQSMIWKLYFSAQRVRRLTALFEECFVSRGDLNLLNSSKAECWGEFGNEMKRNPCRLRMYEKLIQFLAKMIDGCFLWV